MQVFPYTVQYCKLPKGGANPKLNLIFRCIHMHTRLKVKFHYLQYMIKIYIFILCIFCVTLLAAQI